MRKAIIGGTGVYSAFEHARREVIETEYGKVAVDLVEIQGVDFVFLARHGSAHQTPPHKINYRANMKALQILGVDEIYATCAVGSLNDQFEPGQVVLIHDFLDFTKGRVQTYYEGDDGQVAHVEMTSPYCNKLRNYFLNAVCNYKIDYRGSGVYVCTEGPRFETAAEIKFYQMIGGDVVGMTNVPECVLAKELGMCYSAIGVITNWCTGIEGKAITGHQISEAMELNKSELTKMFVDIFIQNAKASTDMNASNCNCQNALLRL